MQTRNECVILEEIGWIFCDILPTTIARGQRRVDDNKTISLHRASVLVQDFHNLEEPLLTLEKRQLIVEKSLEAR